MYAEHDGDAAGPHSSTRDCGRQQAIQREILQGIVNVEKLTTPANLLCWLLVAAAAAALPIWQYFIAPLAFRLLTIVGTRVAFARLRARLAQGGPYQRELAWLGVAIFVGGAAWASTLLPLVLNPFNHPARLLAGGGTLVGLSIIVTLLSPLRSLAIWLSAGFLIAFAIGLSWAPEGRALVSLVGIGSVFVLFAAYSRATVLSNRQSAELLIENRRLGQELAQSLAHAKALAERDPLTGLYNRRAFFELAASQPVGPCGHVLMIDLDHFKAINDRYGHAVGDQVLRGVGEVLGRLTAQGSCQGIAARLGGEEFAMVVDTPDHRLAGLVAEAVRHAIALIATDIGEDGLVTTASVGLAPLLSHDHLESALQQADEALYRAKAHGRDRVMSARAAAA